MRGSKNVFLAILACGGWIGTANADHITVDFPSADATVIASVGVLGSGDLGFFWSVARGDSISETFAGTGLDSIDQLTLLFNVTQNVLSNGASTIWDVMVNGTSVGGWSWSDTDGTGAVNETYDFGPIFGAGSYTIAMEVINEVPRGRGSIAIASSGTATAHTTSVPEPGTLTLLGIGLLGLGIAKRKSA